MKAKWYQLKSKLPHRKKILMIGLLILLCTHQKFIARNKDESIPLSENLLPIQSSEGMVHRSFNINYNARFGISGECSEYINWNFICASNVSMDAWIVDQANWDKMKNFQSFDGKHVASDTPMGSGLTSVSESGKWYFVVIHTDEERNLYPAIGDVTLFFVGAIETTSTTTSTSTTSSSSQTSSSPSSSSSNDGTWLIVVIPIVGVVYAFSKLSKKKEKRYIAPRPHQNLRPFPESYYEEQRQLKLRIMEHERARANRQNDDMDRFLKNLDKDFEDWGSNEKRGGKKK